MIGLPAMLAVFGIFAYAGVIELIEIGQIIAAALIGGMISLAIWAFRPEEKRFDKAEYERELLEKREVENKLEMERMADEFRRTGEWVDTPEKDDEKGKDT